METKKHDLFKSKSAGQATAKRWKPKTKRIIIAAVAAILLVMLYCTAMFSNIPFIKKWRNIYIETAMDTYSHKWLATFFIPESVINDAMALKEEVLKQQQELHSSWEPVASPSPSPSPSEQPETDDSLKQFLRLFGELDALSFTEYIKQYPEFAADGYDHMLINKAGLKDDGTSILTTNGDRVLAIDAENGLLIVEVKGDGYYGKLAIVNDASKVHLGVSQHLGSFGQTVQKIAENNNAVLAINASGFTDDEKRGNGGEVVGLLISDGTMISRPVRSPYLTIGFSFDNHLNIGVPIEKLDYRDAVEFVPALIVNGEAVIKDKKLVNGSMGFGLQPRTIIGQTVDGKVLMLTIDGRQIGYSIGCTVVQCADMLLEYGAYQAANLDGGSSTIMVYRNEVITRPANGIPHGRYVPDAFYVESADSTEEKP